MQIFLCWLDRILLENYVPIDDDVFTVVFSNAL